MKRVAWLLIPLSGCSGRGPAPVGPVDLHVAPYCFAGEAVEVVGLGPDACSVKFTLANTRDGASLERQLSIAPGATVSVVLDAAVLDTLAATGDLTPLEARLSGDMGSISSYFTLLGDRGIQLPGDARISRGIVPGHEPDWPSDASTASADAAFLKVVESWHGASTSISVRPAERSELDHPEWLPASAVLLHYRATGRFARVFVPAAFNPSRTDQVFEPQSLEAILPRAQSAPLLGLQLLPKP